MKIITKIMNHPLYAEHYNKLEELEAGRIFCCHQLQHFIDMARIAYIENLENDMGFSKEMIYAAGMLHDIGRDLQYMEGIPHEKASAKIAEKILNDILNEGDNTFTHEDIRCIITAISEHRFFDENSSKLGKLLYKSDKRSRLCLGCKSEPLCNWEEDKKNKEIYV